MKMMLPKISLKKALVIILFSFVFEGNLVLAGDQPSKQKSAREIADEMGVLKPTEFVVWTNETKEIPKDWVRTQTKYFSVSHPKCFEVRTYFMEDGDPVSAAPAIGLTRKSICPGYDKDNLDSNTLDIERTVSAGFSTLETAFTPDKYLSIENMRINGLAAKNFAGLVDTRNSAKEINEVQLRWQILLFCKKNAIRIAVGNQPGKQSMDRVNAKNFNFPEDFAKVLSTFSCR